MRRAKIIKFPTDKIKRNTSELKSAGVIVRLPERKPTLTELIRNSPTLKSRLG